MLFIWVMLLLQSASAPVDLWAIPAAERIAFINQKLKPETTPNAAADIDRALAAYRAPHELMHPEMSEGELQSVRWLSGNIYCLWIRADWPPERIEAIERWLAANREALEAMEAAYTKERCVRPVSAENGRISSSYSIATLTKFRHLSMLAGTKSNALARAGDWAGAYAWNRRMHRLGAFVRELPDRLAQMNGDGHAKMACDQLLTLIQREPVNAPADTVAYVVRERERKYVAEVIDAYETLVTFDLLERHYAWANDPQSEPTVGEEIDAIIGLPEMLNDFAAGGSGLRPIKPAFTSPEQYRKALLATTPQAYRPVWDRDCELWREWLAKPLPEAIRDVPDLERRYVEVFARHPFAAFLNAGNIVPFDRRRITAARTDAQIAGLECVLAIRAFHQRTGRYPHTLDEIVRQNLQKLPLDPFSSKPLMYRPTPDGFLLYSIGPDLKDDQGVAKHPNGEAADDVLWPPVLPEYSRE